MLAKVLSCAVVGLGGELVDVEVDIARGIPPIITVVGLPDTAVQEARERVRAAVVNSGYNWPPSSRVIINLAPADLRKEGPSYDLPVALGVVMASRQTLCDVEGAVFIGELALDGAVRPVRGVLPMLATAVAKGITRAFVAVNNSAEAAVVPGIDVYPTATLGQLIAHLEGRTPLPLYERGEQPTVFHPATVTDFTDVVGQEHAKRALEIAAAGGHNVIMRGPPGSGKTLLARALPSIMPRMTSEDAMEVTRIYSVAGLLPAGQGLVSERPFRAPHHTVSNAGLVGGGSQPRPGEITLAHRGVLFLDELPEFDPRVLEVLRQPLEDRIVTISRARHSVTFPASFTLVASLNPCPCGYYGDTSRECTCPPQMISRYNRRISGPLLDRIDVFVDVPRVDYEKLAAAARAEPSASVAERVARARERQHERFAGEGTSRLNAEMTPPQVRDFVQVGLDQAANDLLRMAASQLALSARSFHRLLKVSRTIADLEGCEAVTAAHVAESIQYRSRAGTT